ncbi:undecaprenyl/decaprenyl-phosphate alpha-N-acetylglucosaminyl 1-phosphate transferase [Tepidanaerobacter sp. GT38]|uniref:glycosyltransferase family 4 protein n=1 Tax=Tepidanaerobacter sp. GT38 TaxID=2722793 RepID=UPI001F35D3DA|nr:MraY family glycosyltransferase [Tepidanaerobacter sp. GT38]MCG1012316.1 undecaprenyl/decaprenyl-phosphate alpha-N-acetylglucosaminyl 1-phosphate transferase [Tepidanaerobacter sp. GT38]
MPRYIYGFLISMVLAYMITPQVMKLAWKIGAIDKPGDARRVHKKPMPRLGGLAIYFAFVVAGLLILPIKQASIQGILLGATVIVIVGILDDVYNLPAKVKLLGQIAAAGILIMFDVKVQLITNPFGGMFILGKYAIPATLFWIVGITNTLNFIDGLDGLAAGIAAIAAFTMMLVNLSLEQIDGVLVMAILAGAAIGFLPYNFNPAKIFMGDTGAMFLGFVLAAQAVEGAVKSATAIALIVPILALGLPIFDTAFAILRRFVNGKPIMQADKGHVHHRLIAIGLSQKQAVLFMYVISISLGICSLVLAIFGVKQAMIALALVIFMLLVSVRYINITLDAKKSTHGM